MPENRLKSIVEAVAARLRGIDGSAGYNFNLGPDQVVSGYVSFDQAHRYPLICIVGAGEDGSAAADQRLTEIPVFIELVGYTRRDRDVLNEALKLAADIETALLGDQSLTGLVWNLSLRQEVSALAAGPFGGVNVDVRAVTSRE